MEKPNASAEKAPKPAPAPTTPPPGKVPPLFRGVDWLTCGITFLVVFIGYCLTLAPEMTLEDSGELAVASYYLGVPHPPGYPVWTLYTYLWSLIPVSNVAWRVALGCAFSGALASGLLGLVVSRGSSMIIESIDDLKALTRKVENWICLVAGFVAGGLIGFNGYMWSQSVIVEVYPLSVLSLMGVVACLMRWMYAPHQHRYLYWAFFWYGICVNNHQSLLVIAMGMQVLIWLAEPKLGRELFGWNTLIYIAGLAAGSSTLTGNTSVFVIFNLIGLISAALWFWLIFSTRKAGDNTPVTIGLCAVALLYIACLALQPESIFPKRPGAPSRALVQTLLHLIGLGSIGIWIWLVIETGKKAAALLMDFAILALGGSLLALLGGITYYIPRLGGQTGALIGLALLAVASLVTCIVLLRRTLPHLRTWYISLGSGLSWALGMAFYLIMPILGATNPPMQWGYPRTLDGFIHAFTRGQYDKINPTKGFGTTFIEQTASFFGIYGRQLWRFLEGLVNEFNLLYLLIALVVFLFYRQMKRRERVWVLGMVALWVCVGPFLVLLLNFSSDRQSLELNRVFLTSSHVFVAMSIGFGLTLLAASLAVHFRSFRNLAILGGLCALDFAIFILSINAQFNFDPEQAMKFGMWKMACWVAAFTCIVMLWRKGLERDRLLSFGLPGLFILGSAVFSIATLFGENSAGQNLAGVFAAIGKAFSADQYGLPIMAALLLALLAIVYVASVLMNRNSAPMAVTLAVFGLLPAYSVMTHWFENEQREHWFGYWFGHDMFTPPYKDKNGQLSYDAAGRAEAMKGTNGHLVYPEMDRHTILFGGTDPGRFAPTYMIFCDSFIPDSCKPAADPVFDRRDVYIITQNALADGTYLQYIRAHYFRSDEYKYDTYFFQELLRGREERDREGRFNYQTNILARLAGRYLDKPINDMGARIEAERRARGVYPPVEIYTPTPEDSQRCFQAYIEDAQRRLALKQLRPGENVSIVDNRVQVSGQVAVMAINGLLTKVIFDKNPTNEFYVEESFPLDWMFPHLTPFGIIMKINRQPLPELSEEIVQRDHQFWKDYSTRLIGDWIDYDTPVKDIAAFAEKVYMRRNFEGFEGDRKFVRDDQAQKAFSKLRSSIGGIYAWRLGFSSGAPTPPQYIARNEAERQRMIREADFAFKQAFAFCPYSPEAVFRYVQLLANLGRMDDAVLVAETCEKLDPYNTSIKSLLEQLRGPRVRSEGQQQVEAQIAQIEKDLRSNPNDFPKLFDLAQKYWSLQQADKAMQILDGIASNPKADASSIFQVARIYADLNLNPKLEPVLQRLVKLAPNEPEAWYNLAATKASLNKGTEAIKDLKQALELNSRRLAQNPSADDLRIAAQSDHRFASIRDQPEFQQMIRR